MSSVRERLGAFRGLNGAQRHTAMADSGPLAALRAGLLAESDRQEEERHARAERVAFLRSVPPGVLETLVKKVAQQNLLEAVESDFPVASRYETYRLLKSAWKANPNDQGLKYAAGHAKALWTEDPEGSLSVRQVGTMRGHWSDRYPKSRVAEVLSTGLAKVSYADLPIQKISKLAGRVAAGTPDQHALEARFAEVCASANIQGERLDQRRARSLLVALVNAQLADEDPAVPPEDAQDPMHEDEIPHDESEGAIAEATSPNTGDPLVLELELPIVEPGDAMLPADDEFAAGPDMGADNAVAPGAALGMEASPGGGGMAMMGQFDPPAAPFGADDSMPGDDEEPLDGGAEPDSTTSTVVDDPTAPGKLIEVTLKAVPEEGAAETSDEDVFGPDDAPASDDPTAGFAPAAKAPPGAKYERMIQHIKEESPGVNPWAVAWSKHNKGAFVARAQGHTEPVDRFFATNIKQAVAHVARNLEDAGADLRTARVVERGDTATITFASGSVLEVGPDRPAVVAATEPDHGRRVASVVSRVHAAERVEIDVPEGEHRGAWRIELNDQGQVEVSREGVLFRTAALAEVQPAVEWLLGVPGAQAGTKQASAGASSRRGYALHAAYEVGCARCGGIDEYLVRTAAAEPKDAPNVRCATCGDVIPSAVVAGQRQAQFEGRGGVASYVVLADVPHDQLEQRRVLSEIMRCAEDVRGRQEQAEDGSPRFAVSLTTDEAGIARVRNVLETKLGFSPTIERTAQAATEQQTTVPAPVMVQNSGPNIGPTYQPPPSAPSTTAPAVQPPAPPVDATPAAPPPTAPPPASAAPIVVPVPGPAVPGQPVPRKTQAWNVDYQKGRDARTLRAQVDARSEAEAVAALRRYEPGARVVRAQKAVPETMPLPAEPVPPDAAAATDAAAPPAGATPPADPAAAAAPGMPAMPQTGGMVTPEVEQAIQAAMTTLRNTGIDVVSAVDQFSSQFKGFLDSFGDKTSPARAQVAGVILKAAQEAYMQPALLTGGAGMQQSSRGAAVRRAAPKSPTQGTPRGMSLPSGGPPKKTDTVPMAAKPTFETADEGAEAANAMVSNGGKPFKPKNKVKVPSDAAQVMEGNDGDWMPPTARPKRGPKPKSQLSPTDWPSSDTRTTQRWDGVSGRAPGKGGR